MPPDLLARYLRQRHWVDPLIWLLFLAALAAFHTGEVWLAGQRTQGGPALWEAATWEGSSHLAWLILLPVVAGALERWPLYWGSQPLLRRHLLAHAAAAVAVSLAHTGLMVLMRKAVYAAQGLHYDFGEWPRELLYEGLKDVRSYAFIVTLALTWRLVLWRLQGEARVLQAPPEARRSRRRPSACSCVSWARSS